MMSVDATVAQCVERVAPGAWAAYVFGTAGTEWESADSDVDVAVLAGPGEVDFAVLEETLTRSLGRQLDLTDLLNAPTVLKKEVVLTGRAVWVGRPFLAGLFEVQVMGEYQRLCRERAEIVADGIASGRFYA